MQGRDFEMRRLEKNYVFEFAGMPQSGKTLVKETLSHYLKRMEYPLVEFNGGSRCSDLPIYRMPIGELNEELAQRIEKFVRSIATEHLSAHNIYLLDRGLVDRCIFTDTLVRAKKAIQAEKIYKSLLIPEFLEKLDDVFIFSTSPETALEREYAGKLVKREDVRSQGDVMNEAFLQKMYQVIDNLQTENWFREVRTHVKYVEFIDTTYKGNEIQQVARDVFDNIMRKYPELELKLTSTL